MNDEDLFEDVPRDVSSIVVPKDVFENKVTTASSKVSESQPIFVTPLQPANVPQIPLYRPAVPTIVETSLEKCVDKDVIRVFSTSVPIPKFDPSEKLFDNDYFLTNRISNDYLRTRTSDTNKNFNFPTNTAIEYKSEIDPDAKSTAMQSTKSNVTQMKDSTSGIANQKLDATHQPEYGGIESMKERLAADTTESKFNKVEPREGPAEEQESSQTQGCLKKNLKTICLWFFLFLILIIILALLIYYLVGCRAKKTVTECVKPCDEDELVVIEHTTMNIPTCPTFVEVTESFPTTLRSAPIVDDEDEEDDDFSLITAESMEGMESQQLAQLNPAIFPTAYYISITTDFIRFEFNLRVHILLYINEMTNLIVIHGSNYNLDAYVGLIGPENEQYEIENVNLDVDTQFLVMTLKNQTVIGEYNLTMHYSNTIDTVIGGYYRIPYISPHTRNISWLAVTDFKPDKAHLLFPCFDHPMFKATFTLTLGLVDGKSFSFSNMAKTEQRWKRQADSHNLTEMDVSVWDHYETTPLMATLSLAFIVGPNKEDFDVKDRNFIHYIYRKHLLKEMEFAMEYTDDIVKYFESYFNSLYSLPNLYVCSVPNMNHYGVGSWGIILLSESQIFNIPKRTRGSNKYPIEQEKQVILNLSHKLVSQWFGTSVTMSDFSEDWIFEGFAVYMKYRALSKVTRAWTDPGHFYLEVMQPLLLMESLIPRAKYHESHKHIPDELKGAVLMRILENMITEATFDTAMMKLTDNKKLQVAGFTEICELLSDEAQTNQTLSQDLNLCDFLKPYITQRGYPVLKLSRNYVTNGAMITQQQFILKNEIVEKFSESNDTMNNKEQLWIIPTSIANKGCDSTPSQPKTWMPQEKDFSIGILTSNDWALLNDGVTGFYRVNYDNRNWGMIQNQLAVDYKAINPLNRAQIIDDILNLARANEVNYHLAFEIIKYLPTETHYLPWATAFVNFEYFDRMMIKTPEYGIFKKFVTILLIDKYNKRYTTREVDESVYPTLLRNLIGQWACHLDIPDCTQRSIKQFENWMKGDESSISVEDRYMVYCTAIRSTTYKEWEFLWRRYLESDNQYEKELILKALACTYDPWIIELYLWHIISTTTDQIVIQPIHYPIVIEHLAKNPVASNLVIEKVLKHWKSFRKLSKSNIILAQMIKTTFFYVNTQKEYDMFKNWTRDNGAKMKQDYELFQHVEASIESNLFFMKTYMWQVIAWMQTYVQNNTDKLAFIDEHQFDASKNKTNHLFRPIPELPFLSNLNSSKFPEKIVPKVPKPPDKPTVKPADKPTVKPADKPTVKPADKPTVKPADKPTVKPADKPIVNPANKPTVKPADKPTVKPADNATDKPADKPTDNPTTIGDEGGKKVRIIKENESEKILRSYVKDLNQSTLHINKEGQEGQRIVDDGIREKAGT